MNITLDNDTCAGITTAASSANTTAGVPYDTVSIGFGKILGMPHILKATTLLLIKLFNGSADTGMLTIGATHELNVFALNGTPDGTKVVELIYLA
jgi:hypothetical protein